MNPPIPPPGAPPMPPPLSVHGQSTVAATPAVFGEGTGQAIGVHGTSSSSDGVLGEGAVGVYGRDLVGTNNGVIGYSDAGRGVWGHSSTGVGVLGESKGGAGVHGTSSTSDGILGEGPVGAYGRDLSGTGNGVIGYSESGRGVWGHAKNGIGVLGESAEGTGVRGVSTSQVGVWGSSSSFEGVHAETSSTKTAAMAAYQLNVDSDTPAFYAKHNGQRTAAMFEGDVHVTGNQTITGIFTLADADCAEDFDIAVGSCAEPGTVMTLCDDSTLRESCRAYDKRVAGVVSGASIFQPALILDRRSISDTRKPIALLGKVYCKVDARFGSIGVGDLLTTSPTPGHAMVASDPLQAFGSVLGKALKPLANGTALIPVLVALQ